MLSASTLEWGPVEMLLVLVRSTYRVYSLRTTFFCHFFCSYEIFFHIKNTNEMIVLVGLAVIRRLESSQFALVLSDSKAHYMYQYRVRYTHDST